MANYICVESTGGGVFKPSRSAKALRLYGSSFEFDDQSWFKKDRILLFNAHFRDGIALLHYHPGNLQNYVGALLAFSSFFTKVAIMGNIALTLKNATSSAAITRLNEAALSVKATKHGFELTSNWKDALNHLSDASTFAEEGYYGYNNSQAVLVIRGSLAREQLCMD